VETFDEDVTQLNKEYEALRRCVELMVISATINLKTNSCLHTITEVITEDQFKHLYGKSYEECLDGIIQEHLE
jgi:hypothetical protein